MIRFSYADSSHLHLCGTVTIISISVQKETELLAFLCLFPGSLCGQLLSGCHNASGICVCVWLSILQIASTVLLLSLMDQSNPTVASATGAQPERSLQSFQQGSRIECVRLITQSCMKLHLSLGVLNNWSSVFILIGSSKFSIFFFKYSFVIIKVI